MSMIFFDTETTGLLVPEINDISAQPYIVEMYAVKTDDDFDRSLNKVIHNSFNTQVEYFKTNHPNIVPKIILNVRLYD